MGQFGLNDITISASTGCNGLGDSILEGMEVRLFLVRVGMRRQAGILLLGTLVPALPIAFSFWREKMCESSQYNSVDMELQTSESY